MKCDDARLIEYLPWAQRFSRACTAKLPSHLDLENLQSAGIFGYLRASSRFDASKGASFRGFCAVRIRGAILDELRRWDWAPRSVHRNQRRITRVTVSLMEELEREPTDAELAHALGISITELVSYQTQVRSRQMVSLDEITERTQGDDNLSLAERIPDLQATAPDAVIFLAEDRRLVLRCLSTLPKTQATVLALHYLQEIPLRDVAALLVVTPSRVSQIHHQALERLRQAYCRTQALP